MTGRLALPLLLLLTLTLPLPQAHARPLMQEDLPPETRWVAHLDVTALLESDLGRRLLADANADDLEQGRNFVRESAGLDPLTDLHSITAFGPSPDPLKAVAVVRGDFDPDRLLGLVIGPQDERTEHGKHTVYQWTQQTQDPADDSTRYSAFPDPHTLLIARSRAAVERTLDVLDGKAEDTSDSDRVLKVADVAGDEGGKDGSFLVAAARDLQPPAGQREASEPVARMLQKVRDASVRLGQVEGSEHTRLDVRLTAGSQQDADSMRALLQGVTAYGKYLAGQKGDVEVPAWAPVAAAAKVSGTGREVRLTAEMSTRELMGVAAAAAKERARAEESATN